MKTIFIPIDEIYVPTKHRPKLDSDRVEKVAEDFIETGHLMPILVRHDGKRYVLVKGINRLEACRSLGEERIAAFRVQAAQH